jgi:branched-chain amino acid aminotransferase
MIVFLNGKFVPEAEATISVFDRSFLYGDGLFESMRVTRGKPFLWWQHMERLRKGGDFLGIKIPFACKSLETFASELIAKNEMPEALLRLTVSRGVGLRGYSPQGATRPTLVMTMHALPEAPGIATGWKLHTASVRLPAGEKLAQFKTANKLAQVLARAEADVAGADEALLLNTDGFVVEGASSNLFWIQGGVVYTPPMTSGVLAGVTRAIVVELCNEFALPVQEVAITPADLRGTDGVFLTLSSLGVVGAVELDGGRVAQSPLVEKLQHAYDGLLKRES